ncbi:hypothetical protein E2C01_019414 [Portunus trituberculatus]|uniref:Uncharacterized protein n=1 Tax=Portunus trituberculatus TaxID=210409 RepID=A0A5B7DXU5_PORTR|nr:hypothetical protein [Portunus trituberculatus]
MTETSLPCWQCVEKVRPSPRSPPPTQSYRASVALAIMKEERNKCNGEMSANGGRGWSAVDKRSLGMSVMK